jgi:ribose transport system substrate-binding protein
VRRIRRLGPPLGRLEGPRWTSRGRILAVLLLVVVAGVTVSACGSSSSSGSGSNAASSGGGTGKKFTIFISNSLNNPVRDEYLKEAQLCAEECAGIKGKVVLHEITTPSGTTQGQIQDMQNIIAQHPDAIVLDPAAVSALNPITEQACKAGILVVAYDGVMTAPCIATDLETNWYFTEKVMGTWAAQILKGKGSYFGDRGLAGQKTASRQLQGFEDGVNTIPGSQVAGVYSGGFTAEGVRSGVASLLSSFPNVSLIESDNSTALIMAAAKAAGRTAPIPISTATPSNQDTLACLATPGQKCFFGCSPPTLAALGLETAVRDLEGTKPTQKVTYTYCPFLTNDPIPLPGYKNNPNVVIEPLKIGENAFPGRSPNIVVPFQFKDLPNLTVSQLG